MKHRIDEYWSQRAEEFSDTRMNEYDTVLKAMYQHIIVPYIPKTAKTALDIGTGAGFYALLLAEQGLTVQAIDYSEAMLEEAKKNANERGIAVEFIKMDAQQLIFPDQSFDFVFTHNVTWVLEQPDKMYAEAARVLKSGGVFVNIDANYGKAFHEADIAGEAPVHPRQTMEQLRERNAITELLYISKKSRPDWDVDCLRSVGLDVMNIDLTVDERLDQSLHRPTAAASQKRHAPLFLVAAQKNVAVK